VGQLKAPATAIDHFVMAVTATARPRSYKATREAAMEGLKKAGGGRHRYLAASESLESSNDAANDWCFDEFAAHAPDPERAKLFRSSHGAG